MTEAEIKELWSEWTGNQEKISFEEYIWSIHKLIDSSAEKCTLDKYVVQRMKTIQSITSGYVYAPYIPMPMAHGHIYRSE